MEIEGASTALLGATWAQTADVRPRRAVNGWPFESFADRIEVVREQAGGGSSVIAGRGVAEHRLNALHLVAVLIASEAPVWGRSCG